VLFRSEEESSIFEVAAAIQFDGQPGFVAVEIQDVAANGMLAAKFGVL
jgi:hypothetical protein